MKITTDDRPILSHALFIATLGETFAGLGEVERTAFTAALEAARFVNPLDVALVEIITMLHISGDAAPVH